MWIWRFGEKEEMLQGVYLMKTEGVRLRLGSSFSPPLCVSRVSCRSDAYPPPNKKTLSLFFLDKRMQ